MSNELHDGPQAEQPPADVPTLWGEPQILSSPTAISPSRAGDNLVLLFNDLSVELNTAEGPLTAAVMLSLNAPITLHDDRQFLGYFIRVEGFIRKDKNSRANLMVDAAGTLKTFEYSYEEARALTVEQEDGAIVKHFFSIERRGADWQYQNGQRPPIPPVALTLTLTGQRVSGADEVYLKVDAVSIEAIERPA
jgi:hypothetical protein